ncbi:Lysozyme c-1 [Melipona quadrifasciata]|uniref:lysozyme n=1 Tax=Melipona quadrifasciata TaxID=166423 RepID=A0A0N1IT51_9HYME|nr:Lysozyme c-1 [Melipona quadrifasciata]
MNRKTRICVILSLLAVLIDSRAEGKNLTMCQAVNELERARVERTLISNWVCLMQSESKMNTRLVTGPKTASSFSFGIFQINSAKWCSRGHSGGLCNKRCEDFANDDIQDDIVCARKIQSMEGFKAWDGWMKKCKNNTLPNIRNCQQQRKKKGIDERKKADKRKRAEEKKEQKNKKNTATKHVIGKLPFNKILFG